MVFVQDNQSKSTKGVLRGMHYQKEHTQGKLVRVISGKVYDVVVDIRKDSKTYGQWYGATLSAEEKNMMYVRKDLHMVFMFYRTQQSFCINVQTFMIRLPKRNYVE